MDSRMCKSEREEGDVAYCSRDTLDFFRRQNGTVLYAYCLSLSLGKHTFAVGEEQVLSLVTLCVYAHFP